MDKRVLLIATLGVFGHSIAHSEILQLDATGEELFGSTLFSDFTIVFDDTGDGLLQFEEIVLFSGVNMILDPFSQYNGVRYVPAISGVSTASGTPNDVYPCADCWEFTPPTAPSPSDGWFVDRWSYQISVVDSTAPSYTLTVLPDLPGGDDLSHAWDINDVGQVVGYSDTDLGSRAFLWSNGQMTNLGALPTNDPNSAATAINNAGKIAGHSDFTEAPFSQVYSHAVSWHDGQITDLGNFPENQGGTSDQSLAYGIGENGDIVGFGTVYPHSSIGALWDENGIRNMPDLTGVGGVSIGRDINARSQVAGIYVPALVGTWRAVIWEEGVLMNKLHHPVSTALTCEAMAINDFGRAVGYCVDEVGTQYTSRAVVWSLDGSASMILDVAGGVAFDINDADQVVGWTDDFPEGIFYRTAFLWQNGTFYPLNNLIDPGSPDAGNFVPIEATGINELGQIVGSGFLGDVRRAFLMSPISLDSDDDTVVDTMDNCPTVSNVDQFDLDGDGVGNACADLADISGYSDTSGDGIPDFATFKSDLGNEQYAQLHSGANGDNYGSLNFLNPDWQGVAVDMIDDANGDGVTDDPAAAMLLTEPVTGKVLVHVRDATTGATVNKISFLNSNWAPVDVVVFNDTNGDGNANDASIGVMAVEKATGKILIQVRNLSNGAKVATRSFLNLNYIPIAATSASRAGQTPLLGVLSVETATGKILVQTRQLSDGALVKNTRYLNTDWTATDIAAVKDGNSDGVADDPGWLVLANNTVSNATLIQARDVTTGTMIKNISYLSFDYAGLRLATSGDISGNSREEASVYGSRLSDDRRIIQIRDFDDATRTGNIFP